MPVHPSLKVDHGPFFDRGIESITFKHAQETEGLPDLFDLPPPDTTRRQQLDELLAMPTLDSLIDHMLHPTIHDRDLLRPQKFGVVLRHLQADFRRRAAELQASDPASAKVIQRAAKLLNDELGLRDLLHDYRSALFQG